jgi:hypothetical protein
MVLDKDFREFIQLLNENEVKYLVIGGYAVAFHGYPRYTKDLDFWIWANPDNADLLLKTIKDFGLGSMNLSKEDLLDLDNVIQIGYEPNRIDVIIDLEGLDFESCYERRVDSSIGDINIPFIGLDDLIRNKLSTGRMQDKVDADKLKKSKGKKE